MNSQQEDTTTYREKAIRVVANFLKATLATTISSCWENININLGSYAKNTSLKIEMKWRCFLVLCLAILPVCYFPCHRMVASPLALPLPSGQEKRKTEKGRKSCPRSPEPAASFPGAPFTLPLTSHCLEFHHHMGPTYPQGPETICLSQQNFILFLKRKSKVGIKQATS